METQTPSVQEVAQVARLAARLVLESGGETYRAEDTALHITHAFGLDADIIAFPTGLTMTVSRGGEESASTIARVSRTVVDLMKLERINAISRQLCAGQITLREARERLEQVRTQKPLGAAKSVLFAGASAGMFALMFGGDWFALIASGLGGALVQLVLCNIPDQAGMPVSSLVGGFLSAVFTLIATALFKRGDVNLIIVATMMPFLPGLALTNAIRDAMRGDLVSGGARLGQALTRAVVLAGGAGAGLWIYMALGGVVR